MCDLGALSNLIHLGQAATLMDASPAKHMQMSSAGKRLGRFGCSLESTHLAHTPALGQLQLWLSHLHGSQHP